MVTPIRTSDSRLSVVRDYISILLGCALMAVGMAALMVPNDVVSGGLTGLAVIAHSWLGTGVGLVAFLLNIPLLWLAWRHLGGLRYFLRTLVGVIAYSAFIDLAAGLLPVFSEDRLLIIVYGGLLNGVGLAMVFRGRGTTGGMDIVAQLAHKAWGTDFGQAMLAGNVVVFLLAGLVFGADPAMVALLLSWVTSKSLDAVLHGLSATRQAFIISEKHEEITASVLGNLARGVTRLEGTGGYSGAPRPVLLVVVMRHEAQRLKQRIQEIDPHAFVVISTPSEVQGGYPMAWRK
ncbi:MAG TPA: YitT family protein [Candidatus Krumholzibacteria bacterium]|nr:YitT family protein [Candidatus Krumholzibacteria bacterium]HRX51740.1 YitT family protein [Candidatus Krumholzibacteria bacterium]